MIAGSLLLFFFFAYIDEYENLFLGKADTSLVSKADPYEIELTLKTYLKHLSAAYRSPDTDIPADISLSDDLRLELADEIEFLKNDGRIAEHYFPNMWLRNVNPLGPDKVRVSTREIVGVRYISYADKKEIRSLPDAVFDMSYLLEKSEKGWILSRYDVMKIEAIQPDGKGR